MAACVQTRTLACGHLSIANRAAHTHTPLWEGGGGRPANAAPCPSGTLAHATRVDDYVQGSGVSHGTAPGAGARLSHSVHVGMWSMRSPCMQSTTKRSPHSPPPGELRAHIHRHVRRARYAASARYATGTHAGKWSPRGRRGITEGGEGMLVGESAGSERTAAVA